MMASSPKWFRSSVFVAKLLQHFITLRLKWKEKYFQIARFTFVKFIYCIAEINLNAGIGAKLLM